MAAALPTYGDQKICSRPGMLSAVATSCGVNRAFSLLWTTDELHRREWRVCCLWCKMMPAIRACAVQVIWDHLGNHPHFRHVRHQVAATIRYFHCVRIAGSNQGRNLYACFGGASRDADIWTTRLWTSLDGFHWTDTGEILSACASQTLVVDDQVIQPQVYTGGMVYREQSKTFVISGVIFAAAASAVFWGKSLAQCELRSPDRSVQW